MSIWFWADTHFDHANTLNINHCNRPFETVEEMNEAMVENANSVVQPNHTLYTLGDFAFKNHEYWAKQLNGHKHLILGNHDEIKMVEGLFESISHYKEIKYNKVKICLMHYALRTWSAANRGAFHLYGHSHGNLPSYGRSMDVGVDTHDFRPYHIDEIFEILSKIDVHEQWMIKGENCGEI
jgi:calcineurin-like phosphoesterase family protein